MVDHHPIVYILGMHRSGTSCLTGCLERCGLHLGKVRRTGQFNAKGYYELRSVQKLNDQILALNQGSWCNPPSKIHIHEYHKQQIVKIISELNHHRPSGLKDPRLLLILDQLLSLTPAPYSLIGTFRHPVAVAQSLAVRYGSTEEQGVSLWLHYNELLIQHHQTSPFPIIEYDLSDAASYCRNVSTLSNSLGLSAKMSHIRYFVSQKMQHNPVMGIPVPVDCQHAYNYLQKHKININTHPIKTSIKSRHLSNAVGYFKGTLQEAAFNLSRK